MAAAARTMLLHLTLLLLSSGAWVSAFNLDSDNAIRKAGDPGSYFGFSLAMHRQLQPQDRRILLVGAPRTKSFPNQIANVTGGLYSCDIQSPSEACTRVVFDNDVETNKESRENQWMGVSVQSQGPGGKVVTCAHRYERRENVNTEMESRYIIGKCFVLSQELTITLDDDMVEGDDWNFCSGRLMTNEQFGSCQQGVAATFTKDFHYIVFGAPGSYNWKGVVRAEQKNATLDNMLLTEDGDFQEDGPYETGGEKARNENLIPVSANSYLGFSLDTGKGITSQNEMTFVSGAPRSNHSGAVVLFKKDTATHRSLSAEHIFEGEGLASSFGYDVAVVDLNSDGWQDIVVGAPQYFERDGEIGGAVYVYINQKGKWNKVKPIRLNGAKDSMFGLAVENIGDINQDGFQDIAVGAPYDGNTGKVYVYHGTKDGINTIPAQILSGGDHGAQFFGYSIAGNMDLDRNSYPDIAVGSLSDAVTIFRSRPVINIKKRIRVTPDRIDLNKKTCSAPSGICMTVEACFAYTANPKDLNPTITIVYTFETEMERRSRTLSPRVVFADRPADTKSSGTLSLAGQNTERCVSSKLQLQENIKDKLRPIPVSVTVEIQKSARRGKRQSSTLPTLAPILNSNEPNTVTSEVQFLKEGCGADNICHSNLQLSYKFCTWEGTEDKRSYLELENGVPVLVLKDQKLVALEITVTNDGDDAHEASLVASFPDTSLYSNYRALKDGPDKQLSCTAFPNGSVVDCELGNPFKKGSSVSFYLILSTNEISVDTTDLSIPLDLKTTSSQANLIQTVARARVVVELLLSVSGTAKPSQVYFGGTVVGESAMKIEEDVGSLIVFEFRIINLGRPLKTLGTTSLDIQWPKEISNGKWLLYLMKIDSKGLEKVACQPLNEINRLGLKTSPSTRSKRELEEKKSDGGSKSFLSFSEKRKYLKLECNGHAKCVNIRCPLQGLDINAVLVAHSRLWNSTFLEEYADLNYLDILVNATINVDSSATNIKIPNAGTQVRVTVFPEKTVALYTGVPWWIIFVAILAGILMLALLVFLLWKCGFFKRSRYDDSVPKYHAVRIRKEERQFKDGKAKENNEKKQWVTNWSENESYS
ncbi:integrin alpha-6 isoform X1 [Ambystoma mexicanum]|uniref:integrin alpha-6 isoform X1 n=1 Tax=Ambystoma mexicanum TaxID=8296 RepID=UPI0037E965CF